MKVKIEVHETAKGKPTSKDGGWVLAFHRGDRSWDTCPFEYVRESPERYVLWFSLRGLPKPPPLKPRKK